MGENNNQNNAPAFWLGWLIAPLAIILAFVMNEAIGLDMMNDDGMVNFGLLAAATILATVPRILRDNDTLSLSKTQISLGFLLVSLFAGYGAAQVAGPVIAIGVIVLIFGGHLYDRSGRYEESTILTFAVIGFMFALVVAGMADTWAPVEFDANSDGVTENYLDEHRVATAFLFFSTWMSSILLGVIVAIKQRGLLYPAGSGRWMSFLPEPEGKFPPKSAMPLILAMAVWAGAHIGSMLHFGMGDEYVRLGLTLEEVTYSHVGFMWAFFTGIIACVAAFFCAEKWYTRAMLLASVWILYTAGLWQEHGYYSAEWLEGTWGVVIWAGFTFFAFVGAFYIATHEKYGNWANRELNDPSAARRWWSENWAGILIFAAVFTALSVRIIWNVIPAMNAAGTGGWDMTGGSDPWYMKRAIDYVIANHAHFIIDADRAYPIGDINPRPPLFTWSLALGGFVLAPLLQTTPDEAVWWSILALPAIYGALTVLPMAAMAKEHFGKGAGVIAAWLIALMPGHVSHSTFGLADHDAFVLLFLTVGFHYYLKAVKYGGSERLVKNASFSLSYISKAVSAVLTQRRAAVTYACLAGVSIGIVALGWKGFVYGPGILFLAFFTQVILNLIRRKDSTILTTLTVIMFGFAFLLPLPVYGQYQLGLIWDASGMQPLFYIFGFTLALGLIAITYRDKPWLLVFGTAFLSGASIMLILYLLQVLGAYNGWDVLTTGGYYFTKNKIFGTIAEAQPPSRGTLFASFGPIVFILALSSGMMAFWQGARHGRQPRLILGIWVLLASYMSWSAGRFVFNATPAMAVMGAWAIVVLWDWCGAGRFVKQWRRFGIRTPADRFSATRKAIWKNPGFGSIFLVMLLLMSQHATYGLDAGIPRGSGEAPDIDQEIHNMMPDILRYDVWDFSVLDNTDYDNSGGNLWYLGSFGPGFNGYGWNMAHEWLAEQDSDQAFGERPAFVSWWDYGFQALAQGQHPTVSDNFQSGIPATGNMLLSRSQEDLMALFIWQLAEGDLAYSDSHGNGYALTSHFENTLSRHLTTAQMDEFVDIETTMGKSGVLDRTFSVTQVNRDTVLAEGMHLSEGLVVDGSAVVFRVYVNEEIVSCDDSSYDCQGEDYLDQGDAKLVFDSKIRTSEETAYDTTHYIVGDYWYTDDMIDEFDSVSSNLHRKNARLALARQLLTSALDSDGLAALYGDLMDDEVYTVQDSEGLPGETITRNHEIRYFAVDNRLYPVGGHYTQDRYYNYGNPTGIFHAPTTLGGQDVEHFLDTVYMTERGSFKDEMTSEEWDEAMRQDFLAQQAGGDFDPILLNDVRVDQLPAFFDTMIARTYVGYGADTLGLDGNSQPAQHFQQGGSPGSVLAAAPTMPAAMMNHFVIANWYGSGVPEDVGFPENFAEARGVGVANTIVKVLKYYTGTEVCGQVAMSDNGEGMNGARILVERDAFSGEDAMDMDNNTYWIPIGATDVDNDGNWCTTVPAGHIRFSAYVGDNDPISDQDLIRTGVLEQYLNDLVTLNNDDRETNPITGLLAGISNMTWLTEVEINVTGEQGHSGDAYAEELLLEVDASGISGNVMWAGHENFDGEALVGTDFILRNIWSDTDNVTVTTTNGSFTTEDTRIVQGTGEVTFTEPGEFYSDGVAIVYNFTGNYTRSLNDKQSFTGNGTWGGSGVIDAVWIDAMNVTSCVNASIPENATMPENETVCLLVEGDVPTYMVNGLIDAQGRYTADGTVSFTSEMVGATLEGAGLFEGTGILNGTGLFTGIGTFSGPMVQPGSFYVTGLMPGMYNMIAQLDNGREVLLPDPVEIGITPSYDIGMNLPGSRFADNLTNTDGDILSNTTFELQDLGLSDDDVYLIESDENGTFDFGPLPSGEYYYRFDLDSDGFYELNNTLFVNDFSENLTIGFAVPVHQDVSFHIADTVWNSSAGEGQFEAWNNTGRTITFTNAESALMVIEATSDENGDINVELPMGMWIASDTSEMSHLIYREFELLDEDLDLGEWQYAVSVNVTGFVYHPEVYEAEQHEGPMHYIPAGGVGVEFRSGNIYISDVTDVNGSFNAVVPEGMEFDITAFSTTNQSTAGVHVNTTEGMEPLNLTFQLASPGVGVVYVYDNATTYDDSVPNWLPFDIQATSEEGVSWFIEVDSSGRFEFRLPNGNYTLHVEEDALNISDQNVTVDGGLALEWELIGQPGNKTVNLNVFIDVEDDYNFSNGTAVSIELQFIPLVSGHGTQLNITADDYAELGNLSVDLQMGVYDVNIEEQNPRENGSDYQTDPIQPMITVSLGLEDLEETVTIGLERFWLVEAVLLNSSGGAIPNGSLWLYEIDGEGFESLSADENGTIAQYVLQGNYSVVVQGTDINGVQEELRDTLVIDNNSGARRGITWATTPSTWLDIHLAEDSTESNLSSYIITAVSQDDLGNVSLGPTNSTGDMSVSLMPGNWTLHLNRTDVQTRWTVEEGTYNISSEQMTPNGTIEMTVLAQRWVEVGGKVFWDLDGDEIPSGNEGVPDVNVTIVGNVSDVDTVIQTDADGVWRLFVPIEDTFNITVAKEGFSTAWYGNESTPGYVVNTSHESRDIMLVAGQVSVAGNVTHIFEDSDILDRTEITLYPQTGIDRAPVSATLVMNGTTLEWSADLTPGEWIVWAEVTNSTAQEYEVAIGLLDAGVATGGSLDLEIRAGGRVIMTSAWLDFALGEHTLADTNVEGAPMAETPVLTVDIGDGMEWDIEIDENGGIEMLLPTGSVHFSTEFSTTQRGATMNYTGGVSTTIASQADSPAHLLANRRVSHDVTFEVLETVGATEVDGDMLDQVIEWADEDEGLYEEVIITVQVTYSGNEADDHLSVTPSLTTSPDSQDWIVEVLNETGEWAEFSSVDLGIGETDEDAILQANISVRVQAPNASTIRSLEDGHRVNVRLEAEGGSASEVSIKLKAPQTYGLELVEAPTEVGVGSGGEGTLDLVVKNTGNGDDSVVFSVDTSALPEGWDVSPQSATVTVSAVADRMQSFVVHAPEGAEADEHTLIFSITSEDGETTLSHTATVKLAKANLVIESASVKGEAAYFGEQNTISVLVRNDGLLDAVGIMVNITSTNLDPVVYGEFQMDVAAGSTQEFAIVIDLTQASPGTARFEITLDVGDNPVEDMPEPLSFDTKVTNRASDEPSNIVSWVIAAVFAGIVLMVFNTWRKRSTGARF